MAGTTTNFSWPFPTNPDVANVAADMQSLAAAIDATLGNAWTAYTPAWTGTGSNPVIGNGTINGRFKRLGKWGIATGMIVMGTTTTFGTGNYRFGLPPGWSFENSAPIVLCRGTGFVNDAAPVVGYPCTVQYSSATTFAMRTNNTADLTPTVPITFTTSDVITWEILAELQ